MSLKVKSNGINFNVPTIEDLPTERLEEGLVCVVTDENRGGVFVYREANALVNNGGTIFNGWTRQYDGAVNVKWFGAKGDGTEPEVTKTAILAAITNFRVVLIPIGTFAISGAITIPSNSSIVGTSSSESKIISSTMTVFFTGGNSNIEIQNLYLESAQASYGSTVWIASGGSNILVKECNIVSAYRPIGINDSNHKLTTTYVNIIRNKTYTNAAINGGIRVRTALDGVKNVFATFIENDITIEGSTNSDVGIEAWAGNTLCENNKIKAPLMNGQYSGITFGIGENQVARGNYIFGFELGIEIGNTAQGLHIIDGNMIEACRSGCAITTNGIEESVLFTNNVVEFDDKYGIAYDTAFSTKAKSTSFIGNTCIHKDTSDTPAWTSYLDSASRAHIAFYADTFHNSLIISGNTVKNFHTGVRASATGKAVSISNNIFNNVSFPIFDSGGNPKNIFIGNQLHNFQTLRINKYLQASNNTFERASDFPITSGTAPAACPFVQSYTQSDTIVYNTNNIFTECSSSAMAMDTQYAVVGSGYSRCDLEVRENHVVTENITDPSIILSKLTLFGLSSVSVLVKTWYNNDSFIFTEGSTITYLSASPTSGTWRRGDVVKNSTPLVGSPKGWVCTVAGTPGTWVSEGNL